MHFSHRTPHFFLKAAPQITIIKLLLCLHMYTVGMQTHIYTSIQFCLANWSFFVWKLWDHYLGCFFYTWQHIQLVWQHSKIGLWLRSTSIQYRKSKPWLDIYCELPKEHILPLQSTRRRKNLFYTHCKYYFFHSIEGWRRLARVVVHTPQRYIPRRASSGDQSSSTCFPFRSYPRVFTDPNISRCYFKVFGAYTVPQQWWKRSHILLISPTLELKSRAVTAGVAQESVSVHSGYINLTHTRS